MIATVPPFQSQRLPAQVESHALTNVVQNPDNRVRLALVTSIGFSAGSGGAKSQNPTVRDSVAKTFIPICLEYMKDHDPDVRAQSAVALGWFRRDPEHAVPALVRLLDDPELFPRSVACEALRDFGPPAKAALPALEKYAERARGATERETALEAIARISASAE